MANVFVGPILLLFSVDILSQLIFVFSAISRIETSRFLEKRFILVQINGI